jgi:hypothetical protein
MRFPFFGGCFLLSFGTTGAIAGQATAPTRFDLREGEPRAVRHAVSRR